MLTEQSKVNGIQKSLNQNFFPMWKVYAVFLLEGIASIGFQVVAIRQFTPHFGSSIEVTSIVIAFFLAALSFGYMLGGRCKVPSKIPFYMSVNFLFSALAFGVMFSSGIMHYLFSLISLYGTSIDLFYLSLYCFLFLMVPVLLLGTTLPFLSTYITASSPNETTGKSLAFSTLGSFLGALLTSLVFFMFLGVSLTIIVLCSLLISAALIINVRSIYTYIASCFVCALLIWVNMSPSINPNLAETPYASYRVETIPNTFSDAKIFKVNNQNASFHMSSVSSSPYISRVLDLMNNTFGYKYHDIAVLGAGGFSLSQYDKTNNRYTYIDIDPDIGTIASAHFLEAPIKGSLIEQDARQFLQHNKKRYDVIVVDLFSHNTTIPWHVSTQAFFKSIKASVKQDGLVFINVVGDARFSGDFDRRIHNTILSALPYCYVDVHILKNTNRPQNKIYVCLPEDKKGGVLNDDNAFNFITS